jgi:hypothetical protein
MMYTSKALPALAFLLPWLTYTGQHQCAQDDLEALRQLMGPLIGVTVETKTTRTEAKDGAPPQQSDQWRFTTGAVTRSVVYSRFLNQPPDFTGAYPSLANEDMGVGLDGGPFGNWYRGNAIRVLVNGEDVLRARPAKSAEAAAGDPGRLRLVWELADGGELRLDFAVPDGGAGIHARIEMTPVTLAIAAIQVRLTCYPGGFGPAYGQPSHRWSATARAEAEVPRDSAKAADSVFPVLPFAAGEGWVFYADKLQDSGSLGLVLLPEEQAAGEVRLSSYGVSTLLTYPATTRTVHLGFLAFDTANTAAKQAVVDSAAREQQALRTLAISQPEAQR